MDAAGENFFEGGETFVFADGQRLGESEEGVVVVAASWPMPRTSSVTSASAFCFCAR